ncbi:MAG: hypothetical protein U5J99_14645 [Parvularculaceae bacterium]|nr:hypothetical protein [Parvularculaceae bacterium]
MSAALILLAAGGASILTFVCGRFLSQRDWLADKPGPRSSHEKATPRTGGIAVMTAFFIAASGVSRLDPATLKFIALTAGAFALGLADDVRPLPAAVKLLGQMLIASLFVIVLGSVSVVPAPFVGEVTLGIFAPALTVFWIVAFMNAYNFMDGANGLAATAAIFALSALGVAAAGGGEAAWAGQSIILAAAIFGFLPLNFPKARLFLGDGGSQAIGFAAAALGALVAKSEAGSALFLPTVFMPFLFDVAFTLLHRSARRQKLAEAHNEHLYQLLIRLGASHTTVTSIYLALIALATLAAIFGAALPASAQFITPVALLAAFAAPAIIIFNKAKAAGLLTPRALPAKPQARPFARAAE